MVLLFRYIYAACIIWIDRQPGLNAFRTKPGIGICAPLLGCTASVTRVVGCQSQYLFRDKSLRYLGIIEPDRGRIAKETDICQLVVRHADLLPVV